MAICYAEFSRVHGVGLVVADGREDRGVGEVLLDHLDRLADDVQVALAARVPDVVRNQVSGPQNQVQVLVNNVGRRVRGGGFYRAKTRVRCG